MQRVVVLGRGGAGKTTAARRLGKVIDAPVLELDRYFWSDDLTATPPARWASVQAELAAGERWVMDGDLGPYDVLAPRLCRADTVVVLDLGLPRCACRALRRSRERVDFWWWLLTWRRRSRPVVAAAIRSYGRGADVHVITSPRQLTAFLRDAGPDTGPDVGA
ncbi:hypothetical protein EV188_101961 [Actinomycetospora succinea]|uniref:Adenylate kinase family enzyme n=1 Tax=Actinomycetospora succinea TaxID=663603 RepID=A0A4R6VP80_9PSEU|nr:adenylate kinase [Actinomycetospora succinea]TDQ65709.1 hypothetical protein EV188_101961 [Actinomycetospora succinea]